MANLSFRVGVRRLIPPWLRDRTQLAKTTGLRLLASFGCVLDALVQLGIEGVQSSMPTHAPASALPFLGRDRRIIRGPLQSNADYAEQLTHWIAYHQQAGNAPTLARMLQRYLGPSPYPMVRVVTRSGFWTTLNPDGSLSFAHGTAWDWDSVTHPERAGNTDIWVIVYEPSLPEAGTWGDGGEGYWDEAKAWDHDTSTENAQRIRDLLEQWKGAHAFVRALIFAYDAASFDPADSGTYPTDGLWGHWSKLVGGVQRPSRLDTAHYWETP